MPDCRIGVDLGVTSTRAALLQMESSRSVHIQVQPTSRYASAAEVLEGVRQVIAAVIPADRAELRAIVMAAPGPLSKMRTKSA